MGILFNYSEELYHAVSVVGHSIPVDSLSLSPYYENDLIKRWESQKTDPLENGLYSKNMCRNTERQFGLSRPAGRP